MQPSAGVHGPAVLDAHKTPSSAAARPAVVVFRLAAALAWPLGFYLYFDVFGDTESPDTFSAGSWALMLLPPAVLAIALVLGLWLRTTDPPSRWLYISRASAFIVTLVLVVACAFSLFWFVGELFDYGFD